MDTTDTAAPTNSLIQPATSSSVETATATSRVPFEDILAAWSNILPLTQAIIDILKAVYKDSDRGFRDTTL